MKLFPLDNYKLVYFYLNEKTPQDIERQTRDMPAAEARKIP
jgi:hypothetical protein